MSSKFDITLVQGDSLAVLHALPDEYFDSIVTDPPYGISYRSTRGEAMANDKRPFIWWLSDAYRVMKPTGSLLCFCRWDVQETFQQAIEIAGFKVRSQVIWDKTTGGMGDTSGAFAPQHEVLWFATKGLFRFASVRPKTVFRIPRLYKNRVHPTQKPIRLMRELVRSVTSPKEKVLDPFLGSGTTALACFEEHRSIVGIEINPQHIRTCKRRLREHGAEYRHIVQQRVLISQLTLQSKKGTVLCPRLLPRPRSGSGFN